MCLVGRSTLLTVDDCLLEPGTWDYSKNGSQNGDDVGVDLLGSRN